MEKEMKFTVNHLFIGTPKDVGNIKFKTAISKNNVNQINVEKSQIIGDKVANLKHHGGDNRVLHQYPLENLDFWNEKYSTSNFIPGCLGENLTAIGMNEENVCIGDIYQIGEVECVVTEPRKPCGTISLKMNIKGLAKQIQNESRTGWFYKISKPGLINHGDSIELKNRPYPKLTIKNCVRALLLNEDRETLELMAINPVLSENWVTPSKRLLEKSELENDSPRLGE